MLEKLKSFLADDALFYCALILLVGVGSFGLGRQSVLDTRQGTKTEKTEIQVIQQATPAVSASSDRVAVVASKSGTKYHLPSCPGASQIKKANLIEFASIELAEAAGYTPAANCPELD